MSKTSLFNKFFHFFQHQLLDETDEENVWYDARQPEVNNSYNKNVDFKVLIRPFVADALGDFLDLETERFDEQEEGQIRPTLNASENCSSFEISKLLGIPESKILEWVEDGLYTPIGQVGRTSIFDGEVLESMADRHSNEMSEEVITRAQYDQMCTICNHIEATGNTILDLIILLERSSREELTSNTASYFHKVQHCYLVDFQGSFWVIEYTIPFLGMVVYSPRFTFTACPSAEAGKALFREKSS